MKNFTRHIAVFYISLMVLFKVVGLHGIMHHTDDVDPEHCEVCIVTMTVNLVPLLEAEAPVIPVPTFYHVAQKLNTKVPNVVYHNKHLSSYLFTRPPPRLS